MAGAPDINKTIRVDTYETTYVRRYVDMMPRSAVTGNMATGGYRGAGQLNFAARGIAGFKTNGPTLVGEGDQAYPEYVLATDPQYRKRNLALLMAAAKDMGVGAMAGGGGGSGWGMGGGTMHVTVQILTPTGLIPDSTMRQLRAQLFELGNDLTPGSIVPP